MKVLIAAASFSSELSGVQRHAFNLARCLLSHPDISIVSMAVAPWQEELLRASGLQSHARFYGHIAEMKRGSLCRNLWYFRELPRLAALLRVNITHLAYPVPIRASAFHCPTVVSLHDLYPYEIPDNFGFPKVLFNQIVLKQCLNEVDSVACVSDATRSLLATYASTQVRRKATCIYNCVERVTRRIDASPIAQWKGEPFLLCVAQHRRNKNVPFLLAVMEKLVRDNRSLMLVVVGIAGPETHSIRRTIDRLGLRQNVLLMQGLPEAELQWLYRNCKALVAPSLAEGFGLPVAEALLVGCHVVCSDIPAFREVGGDNCCYVLLDGDAESSFTKAIVETMRKPPRQPFAMPQFSASTIATQYVDLYERLLHSFETAEYLQSSALPSKIGTERL